MAILDKDFETNSCVSERTLCFSYEGNERWTAKGYSKDGLINGSPFFAIKTNNNMILPTQDGSVDIFNDNNPDLAKLFGVHIIDKPIGFKDVSIITTNDIQLPYACNENGIFVSCKGVLFGKQINGVKHDKVSIKINDLDVEFITINKDDYRVGETRRVILTSREKGGELSYGYFTNGLDVYYGLNDYRAIENFFYKKRKNSNDMYINIPIEDVYKDTNNFDYYYKTPYSKDGDKYISIYTPSNLTVEKITTDVIDQGQVFYKGDVYTNDFPNTSTVYKREKKDMDKVSLYHYVEFDYLDSLSTTDGYGDSKIVRVENLGNYVNKIEVDFRNFQKQDGDFIMGFISELKDETDSQNDIKLIHLNKNDLPFLTLTEDGAEKCKLPVRVYRKDGTDQNGVYDYWCQVMLCNGRFLTFRYRTGGEDSIGMDGYIETDDEKPKHYKLSLDNEAILSSDKKILLHPIMCKSAFQDLVGEVTEFGNGDEMKFVTSSDGLEWYGYPENGVIKKDKYNYENGYDFFYRLKRELDGKNVMQYFYTPIYNACIPNIIICENNGQKIVIITGSKYADGKNLNGSWDDNDNTCRYLKYYNFSVIIYTGEDSNKEEIYLGDSGEMKKYTIKGNTFFGKEFDISFLDNSIGIGAYTWQITDITGMKTLFNTDCCRNFLNISE